MIKEFIIIFAINYLGTLISDALKLPIPGTIIGMILFFLLLHFKIIKVEKIERATSFLLLNMTLFFLPPGVKILDNIHYLSGNLIKAVFLLVFTTFITMGITGKIVQFMIDIIEKKKLKTRKQDSERNNNG